MSSPRGEAIPDTVAAWKHHSHLLGDLVEEQRTEINKLKAKVNKLKQAKLEGNTDGTN